MKWITSHRHHALAAVLISFTSTGCATAMSAPTISRIERPAPTDQVPLKFKRHNFEVFCYNAVGCRVIYNNHDFTLPPHGQDPDAVISPAPPSPDYRDRWGFASYLGVRNFPAPAHVHWKSLDGVAHEAQVDIGAIFRDELILHNVPKDDMAHFYEGPVAGEPGVFLEVNDRTINVYMKMFIPTKTLQRSGHEHSDYRADLILAWSQTY